MQTLMQMQNEAARETLASRVHTSQWKVAADLKPSLHSRMCACLWGIFIADALSAPAHWYYDTRALKRDYGTITGYVAPHEHHATNSIMFNHWKINKHNVRGLIEGGLFLHGKADFWSKEFTHYHVGLRAGENTLNAQSARVLMRTMLSEDGQYNSQSFLAQYKDFMTIPGSHNDTYAEAFHRQLLDNHLVKGMPLDQSAGAENHDTPSIGGFVMLPPVILTAVADGHATALDSMEKHLLLTHRSARLVANARIYAELLLSLLRGAALQEATSHAAKQLGIDLPSLVGQRISDEDVVARIFGMACYISDSFPVALYFAHKYADDPRAAFLANTNAGGENCHRGSALGAILGAAVGIEGIPAEFLSGLMASTELKREIDGLVNAIIARQVAAPTMYLPMVVNGASVLSHQGDNNWLVDNSVFQANPQDTPGLSYRLRKHVDARDPRNRGPAWGDIVKGFDTGDGWLRVTVPAERDEL